MIFNFAAIAATAALLLKGAEAAAVEKRIPIIGAFSVSPTRACPLVNGSVNQLTYGNDCGKCNNFYGGAVMQSIDVHGQIYNGQCIITVHNTADCSDPGTVSGPGCWSPEGGIKGWTITCPWADPNQTYQPPCAHY